MAQDRDAPSTLTLPAGIPLDNIDVFGKLAYTLLSDTVANRRVMANTLKRIEQEILAGTFSYRTYFPNSPKADLFEPPRPSVAMPTAAELQNAAAGAFVKIRATGEPASVAVGNCPLFSEFSDRWYQSKEVEWMHSTQVKVCGRRLVLDEELLGVEAQLAALEEEICRLRPLAPFDGMLFDLPPDVAPGQWLPRNTHIATLARLDDWRLETILPETEVARIAIGRWGRFIAETAGGPSFWVKVERIDDDASRTLPEAMVAAPRGGQILAREKGQSLFPDHAMYRVTLHVLGQPALPQVLRGKVVILGDPPTVAAAFVRSAAGLLIRESGFGELTIFGGLTPPPGSAPHRILVRSAGHRQFRCRARRRWYLHELATELPWTTERNRRSRMARAPLRLRRLGGFGHEDVLVRWMQQMPSTGVE